MTEEGKKAGKTAGVIFAAMSLYALFLINYVCKKGLPIYLIDNETDRIFWLTYFVGFAGLTLSLSLLNFVKTTKFVRCMRLFFLIVFLVGQAYLIIDIITKWALSSSFFYLTTIVERMFEIILFDLSCGIIPGIARNSDTLLFIGFNSGT